MREISNGKTIEVPYKDRELPEEASAGSFGARKHAEKASAGTF